MWYPDKQLRVQVLCGWKKKKRSAEPADMQGNFFITMAPWLPTYMYI